MPVAITLPSVINGASTHFKYTLQVSPMQINVEITVTFGLNLNKKYYIINTARIIKSVA